MLWVIGYGLLVIGYWLWVMGYGLLVIGNSQQLFSFMLQDPNFRVPIAISFGAVAGALSRYYITLWFASRFSTAFPYATFFINITGCLAMGLFITLVSERVAMIPVEVRLMVTRSEERRVGKEC